MSRIKKRGKKKVAVLNAHVLKKEKKKKKKQAISQDTRVRRKMETLAMRVQPLVKSKR